MLRARRLGGPPAGWVVVTLVASLLGPVPAAAGGFSITAFGARRTGMLANLAAPDDLTALFHNPAGLADQLGVRVHFSGSTTFLESDFRLQALDPVRYPAINPAGCGTSGHAACPWPIDASGYYTRNIQPTSYFGVLPYVGASTDLAFLGTRGRDVVVSLAVTAPNLYGANLPANAPTAYNYSSGLFAMISTYLGAGWRINDWVSVGGAVSYNYMLLNYSQRISLADSLRGPNPTPAQATQADQAQSLFGDLNLDYKGSDQGVGWNVGVLVRPRRWVTLAFTYAGATSPRFNGPVTITSTNAPWVDMGQAVQSMGIRLPQRLSVEQGIPHALAWGLNVHPSRRWEIGVDYRLWLYNLLGRETIAPIYAPGTTIDQEPLTTDSLSKNKDYGTSWEVSLGGLFRPRPTVEVMTGICFDKSPLPDKWFSLDNPSMDRIVWTAGVRWQVTPRYRVAASYLFDYYLPRDIRTSASTPAMNLKATAIGNTPRLEIEGVF